MHYSKPLRFLERFFIRQKGRKDGKLGLAYIGQDNTIESDCLSLFSSMGERDVIANLNKSTADLSNLQQRQARLLEELDIIRKKRAQYEARKLEAISNQKNVCKIGEENLPDELRERRRLYEVERSFARLSAEVVEERHREERNLRELAEIRAIIDARSSILEKQIESVKALRDIRLNIYADSVKAELIKRARERG